MNRLVKRGEVIGVSIRSYDPPTNIPFIACGDLDNERYMVLAVVDSIWDYKNDKTYGEMILITGHGDINTDVIVRVRHLKPDYTLDDKIEEYDPHDIYGDEKRWKSEIEKREKQIANWKKVINSNSEYKRKEKLERIIDGE